MPEKDEKKGKRKKFEYILLDDLLPVDDVVGSGKMIFGATLNWDLLESERSNEQESGKKKNEQKKK